MFRRYAACYLIRCRHAAISISPPRYIAAEFVFSLRAMPFRAMSLLSFASRRLPLFSLRFIDCLRHAAACCHSVFTPLATLCALF